MFFRKRDVEIYRKVDSMNYNLNSSFSRVKGDMHNIKEWLDFLYRRAQHQDKYILDQSRQMILLKRQISDIPKTRDEIRQIIDSYYAFEDLEKEIVSIRRRLYEVEGLKPAVSRLTELQSPIFDRLDELNSRVSKIEAGVSTESRTPSEKRQVFREKIVQKIVKNSKDYVKNMVISLIRKYERISALKLREMMVEEQGLVSKSSFYRILEEIETLEEVTVVRDGKEKHYLISALAHNKA